MITDTTSALTAENSGRTEAGGRVHGEPPDIVMRVITLAPTGWAGGGGGGGGSDRGAVSMRASA